MWIPNILTGFRVLLAILFPFMTSDFWLIVLSMALITEFLDGALARKFNWVTASGQIMDPVADRLLALSVGLTLMFADRILVTSLLLVLTRDFVVTLGFVTTLLFFKQTDIIQIFRPNRWGKVTTFLQYLVFYDILLFSPPHQVLIWLTATLSVISAGSYSLNFYKSVRE